MYSLFASLVETLAGVLSPVFAASATAAAIIAFTMLVRIALHPLARAAVRGEKARRKLAPQLAVVRKKYAKNPERMQKEILALHAKEGTSMFAGMLPMLAQLPIFFVMYHVFSSAKVGGESNELLGHTLFAAPLGSRWTDALADGGLFGPRGLVYAGLFLVIAAVASWSFVRARKQAAGAELPELPGVGAGAGASMVKWMPLLSFGTLITAAVVPLAAGLYVATTTAWTVAERAWLHREKPAEGPEWAVRARRRAVQSVNAVLRSAR
ncbi:YidC/Oxa1 family membrane protein insertase [Streptomyces sp. NPDC051561]|uniref:YidC/Oxa1 family membrane protein insertase n=1 Tax=Streptomyces sp. NPDC051561 TaxID=3365658 RepID=UPI0037AED1BD